MADYAVKIEYRSGTQEEVLVDRPTAKAARQRVEERFSEAETAITILSVRKITQAQRDQFWNAIEI